MGGGSSRQIENQEAYVSKHLSTMKAALPKDKYNDTQIKGRLRQEFNGETYREKDSWVMDRTWNYAKRAR